MYIVPPIHFPLLRLHNSPLHYLLLFPHFKLHYLLLSMNAIERHPYCVCLPLFFPPTLFSVDSYTQQNTTLIPCLSVFTPIQLLLFSVSHKEDRTTTYLHTFIFPLVHNLYLSSTLINTTFPYSSSGTLYLLPVLINKTFPYSSTPKLSLSTNSHKHNRINSPSPSPSTSSSSRLLPFYHTCSNMTEGSSTHLPCTSTALFTTFYLHLSSVNQDTPYPFYDAALLSSPA